MGDLPVYSNTYSIFVSSSASRLEFRGKIILMTICINITFSFSDVVFSEVFIVSTAITFTIRVLDRINRIRVILSDLILWIALDRCITSRSGDRQINKIRMSAA